MKGAKDFEVQCKHTKPAQDNRMSLWIFFFLLQVCQYSIRQSF